MAEGQTKDWEYKLETAAGTFHNSSGDHSGEGKATITFEDGRVETYEGEYNEQVRYGHGVYKYHNGDVYTGSWQGGNKAGIGSLVYAEAKDGEGEGEARPAPYRAKASTSGIMVARAPESTLRTYVTVAGASLTPTATRIPGSGCEGRSTGPVRIALRAIRHAW